MQKFYASNFFDVCKVSAQWAANHRGNDAAIPEEFRKDQATKIGSYDMTFRALGLSASAASFKKMADALNKEDCKWSEAAKFAEELLGRLIDEVDDKQFFSLSLRESDFYISPKRGWESAITRFPAIIDDVEESSKCFALSRYPSAVFHSIQIIEAGLIELGQFLKVKDPHSGWTAVAGALQKVIDKKHSERSRFEKKNFAFLEQMQGLVQGLKNAWRNKISHAHGRLTLISKEFSPEVAEEILMASRAFMRRLAEELPPPKSRKRRAAK